MEKSEQIGQLVAALSVAQGQLKSAPFNRVNPHFKNRYADLTSVIDTSRTALASNGLSVMQFLSADGAKVNVRTMLAHKSGEWVADTLTLTASKADPQGVGSAITYAKRYGWCAILGISADDDDDANAAATPPPAQRPVVSPNGESPASVETYKGRFAGLVKGWANVAPEDMKAAAMQVAKACKFDIAKATDDDFKQAAEYVEAHRQNQTFAEWAKENA